MLLKVMKTIVIFYFNLISIFQYLNKRKIYEFFDFEIGWQYRWFTVDAQAGTLSYYICDNNTEDSIPPTFIGNTPPRWQVS